MFREMTDADVPAVWEIEAALFPEDAWPMGMFHEELAQRGTRRYWVAEDEGRIVAYCGMMCILPLADVQTIAVLPSYEGRGIGSTLLRGLIEAAAERGAQDVLLEVRADNPRAQGLYEHFGFEHIHTRRGYYPGGIDARIMKLALKD